VLFAGFAADSRATFAFAGVRPVADNCVHFRHARAPLSCERCPRRTRERTMKKTTSSRRANAARTIGFAAEGRSPERRRSSTCTSTVRVVSMIFLVLEQFVYVYVYSQQCTVDRVQYKL
jgi:hypothetical protein